MDLRHYSLLNCKPHNSDRGNNPCVRKIVKYFKLTTGPLTMNIVGNKKGH